MIKYTLLLWNPITRKYQISWEGYDIIRAKIMLNKPYNSRCTRRLIRTQVDTLVKCSKNETVDVTTIVG